MKVALFDLDSTLLPIDSDYSWGVFMQRLSWVDTQTFQKKNEAFYQQYKEQRLDIDAYVDFTTQAIREKGMAQAQQAHGQFMREVIEPHIKPQAQEVVERCRQEGYVCVLVTATNDFITAPIAQAFGIEHLIATTLEVDAQGELTSRYVGTPSFKEGKVTRMTQWLADKGHSWGSLSDSRFYSDSINDLPLLEQVAHPIATNPDLKLTEIAQQRGWPILRLFE